MRSDRPEHIRALLRSDGEITIGSGVTKVPDVPLRMHVVLAFAAVYLIWGSTYLGIRYAVETIPPLVMMGVRHLLGGVVVYAWARRRGAASPEPVQWAYAACAGALLFLGGHGILAWAEQKIPSGLAALLCATLPLWTVFIGWMEGREGKLSGRVWMGMLLGFAGVVLLVGPGNMHRGGSLDRLGVSGAVLSAFLWAVGTLYSRRVRLPSSTMLSAAMQMVSGGILLLLVGFAVGETRQFHLASVTGRSVAALAYLIVFGSIVAFTAFTWLVTVSSPSMISTYAYVNPVVAVLIGWAVAGEMLNLRILAATAIIVVSVVLVSRRQGTAPVIDTDRQTPGIGELQAAGD